MLRKLQSSQHSVTRRRTNLLSVTREGSIHGRGPIIPLGGASKACTAWFTGGSIVRESWQAYGKASLSALFLRDRARKGNDF